MYLLFSQSYLLFSLYIYYLVIYIYYLAYVFIIYLNQAQRKESQEIYVNEEELTQEKKRDLDRLDVTHNQSK